MVIEKLAELDYDELIAFKVISKNDYLRDTFFDEVEIPLSDVEKQIIDNRLSGELKSLIFDVFDTIILSSNEYISSYRKISSTIGVTVEVKKETIEPIVEVIKVVEDVTPEVSNKMPRRYGKSKILDDISKQGGKINNSQLTALDLNKHKNLFVRLEKRVNKNLLSDDKEISDEDLRSIRSAIRMFDNIINKIIKK